MKTSKINEFYLDLEKDIIVELYKEKDRFFYVLRTPNHSTGNLISNLAKLCNLKISYDEKGLKIIKDEIPSYIDSHNNRIYILRFGNTKVANIYEDGRVELKASIPAISKTLMSQTKDYKLDITKTIIKTFILENNKFHSDLHTHMNGILAPDILIALGITHQIRYPLYYIKKLGLKLNKRQYNQLIKQREKVSRQFVDYDLTGKYLERRIDDNTFINFADLILNNQQHMKENISKIRASLSIMKDGQAVFTNLEKVYLYRYVFTKGISHDVEISLDKYERIVDKEILNVVRQIMEDRQDYRYKNNTLFQDKLLWIARTYHLLGINYVEISDTTLVKRHESVKMLESVHEIMPYIYDEYGVMIRFLAAIRRIPLTILKDSKTDENYLNDNLEVLNIVSKDPYVAGSDIVGEEVNDICELQPVIKELVAITRRHPGFVIRIHAGENDSLTDNVYNSVKLIKDSLSKNQKMPRIRLGHGLYTANLNSKKGRELLSLLKDNNVTLEFQISSNVRLNNLNSLSSHPLKKYLDKNINCVVGTDGMALYGTNCIDEQLSLEKLLDLKNEDLQKIKNTENRIICEGIDDFVKKVRYFDKLLDKKSFEEIFNPSKQYLRKRVVSGVIDLKDSYTEFQDDIFELPWDKYPIVLAGGSFNSSHRLTRMDKKACEIIDELVERLSPDEVFFVIGNRMNAYERYLVRKCKNRFTIFAVVPNYISTDEIKAIKKTTVKIRVSPERSMGLYKSINYEIFERRPSTLIVFDGNSAAANLIQEANNGKGKSIIYVYENSPLYNKALSLRGYVKIFDSPEIIEDIVKFK